MNAKEFVDAIRIRVSDSSIRSVKQYITAPPGRSPEKAILDLAHWFNAKNDDDKEKISEIIKLAVDTSVFGFLCVLDGVRSIEDTLDKGQLSLYYQKDDIMELLNDPEGDSLHELL